MMNTPFEIAKALGRGARNPATWDEADSRPGDDGRPLGDLTAALVVAAQSTERPPAELAEHVVDAIVGAGRRIVVRGAAMGRSLGDLERAARHAAAVLLEFANPAVDQTEST